MKSITCPFTYVVNKKGESCGLVMPEEPTLYWKLIQPVQRVPTSACSVALAAGSMSGPALIIPHQVSDVFLESRKLEATFHLGRQLDIKCAYAKHV